MIGLSGLEYKILKMADGPRGYYATANGPWWMKLLYDFGILQLYIDRLVENGLLNEKRIGFHYTTTSEGFWTVFDYDAMELGNH